MSNATIIQTNEEIFIGSDSATSISLNGQLYRMDNHATKLYKFDNLVLFCSGDLDYCYKITNIFAKQNNKTIHAFRDILRASHVNENVDAVICEYKDNKTWLYQISPYNNFEFITHTNLPKGGVNVISAGIKTVESFELANKHLVTGKTVSDLYKSIFNEISFEGIGGKLTVYRINRKGINVFLEHEIVENDNLKLVSTDTLIMHCKQHLIVGERIYGKLISGVNLALEDENGIFKIQGSKSEIFDRNGTLVMKMGLVSENPDTFGLWSFNDITRVRVDDRSGFAIDRANTDSINYPDGWETIMWASPLDGTLYTHDLVAQNIKIVNNIGKTILDAENNYLDIGDFQNIVMDNKFTTIEKMQIIAELYKIEASYKRILEQAAEYIVSERDDVFDTSAQFFTKLPSTKELFSTQPLKDAYNDLITYISQFIKVNSASPLSIDVNDPLTETTSEIPDRGEFILKFQTYYSEEENLRNKIEDAQFYSGLNMGVNYNNVVIGEYGFIALRNDGKYRAWLNATNGLALQRWETDRWVNKVYASIGSSDYADGTLIAEDLVARRLRIETKLGGVLLDADALNFDFSVLDSIILDDAIMATEKITLANQYKSITKQYVALKEQTTRYATTIYNDRDSTYYGLDQAQSSLVTAGNNLDSAYNALMAYMNPIFTDMNKTTHIISDLHSTRVIFHSKWEDFYKAYEEARSKLADFLEKSSLQLGRDYNNTVIDAENGIVVTRGNRKNRTTLNATEGIKIEQNIGSASSPIWVDRFSVDLDGFLFAEELRTKALRILDGTLGEAIILDALTGITINGGNGEQIRLNANEGIAIDVYNDPRFWIHTDGTLRAKKLIIEPELTEDLVIDEETDGYISDLMVNSLKAVTKNGEKQDYVYIRNNFIKLNTGTSSVNDITKFKLHLKNEGDEYSYPEMIWGQGNGVGSNIGYITKLPDSFKFQYTSDSGKMRALEFKAAQGDAVRLYAEGGEVKLESDTKITLACGSSTITLTPGGVKIKGTRIDLN